MSGLRFKAFRPRAIRLALLASACLVPGFLSDAEAAGPVRRHSRDDSAAAQQLAQQHARAADASSQKVAAGGIIQSIAVQGNSRIETPTVLSYMVVQPGDPFSRDGINRSLKTLYATGLFSDVTMKREGGTLIVQVRENPIVNRIIFEGNHGLKDNDMLKEMALRARAVFSAQTVAADRQKILNLYASKSRFGTTVTPQIIRLGHNRVDVVFKINESPQTLIEKIVFVGNKHFSQGDLAAVISSKESAWYRFFSSSDEYNPERVRYDQELLRRFYLHNGFVDFHMVDATGELSEDHKTFYITYTVHEGPRYRLDKVSIRSNVPNVTPKGMKSHLEVYKGQYYDGTAIQDNATDMQDWLQDNGHPFAQVRTDIARNPEKKLVDLLFDIVEGPRVYVERIDINGNTITRGDVIRRNMPMGEGDAYTPADRKYTKMALQDMGFFKNVSVDETQGSAPDKVNVSANVVEKPTGEFSLGGGYSTDVGIMGNLGLKQHNLLGTGVDAGFSGTVAYYEQQADISVTDPYFLGRNFVAGADIYFVQNDYQTYQKYKEGQYGFSLRAGYSFNRYLSQSWTYTLVDRQVGNAFPGHYAGNNYDTPSIYVLQDAGWSLLSQISTNFTYDRRDNRVMPHSGFMLNLGGDFAGLGGNEKYARVKFNGVGYIPLDSITGNHAWTIEMRGGIGYMGDWSHSGDRNIIDNFYLGGQNLRGFLQGGVGPRSSHFRCHGPGTSSGPYGAGGWCPWAGQDDFLGGKFMYTASWQLDFPLPMGEALGISGRGFIDSGSLAGIRVRHRYDRKGTPQVPGLGAATYTPISGDTLIPRVSGGLGISWNSPFGRVNIDGAVPIHKYRGDRVYPIRFGFGQQF
ncbi:outer membrane protein assembly factor BamA [Oecophyllibacter saccharovorans]|uniref:outer membrane protein assembly factor BamA n=1 Tax=Oecophyllibacter saccharovorans TaxID=2558360 RepID=UPI001E5D99F4|nr:outer membrane protein assembly factor BamA [Oecophyllibacter saccharovorans]